MTDFAGDQPQVGEILALRTFRIGEAGGLFPLFDDRAWSDQMNTAQCPLAMAGDQPIADRPAHVPPDADCSCGFYAYGTPTAALDYPHARHVLAVVACWGKVIAGTRGIRAQHARLQAIFMSDRVPVDLSRLVAARYSDAQVYGDRARMLTRHVPTVLDCYDPPAPAGRCRRRTAARTAVSGALLLSLAHHWSGTTAAAVLWAVQGTLLVLSAILNSAILSSAIPDSGRPAGRPAQQHWVVLAAAALWVLAPAAGLAGWLLIRVPLAEVVLVILLVRRSGIAASRRFPAEIGQGHRTRPR